MTPGDHVKAFRGFYWHHGIYVGHGSVVHYSGEPLARRLAAVQRAPLEAFADAGNIEVVGHTSCLPAAEVVRRAEGRLGETGYHLFRNNCEHFARWCKTGVARSQQVDAVKVAALVAGVLLGVGLPAVRAMRA